MFSNVELVTFMWIRRLDIGFYFANTFVHLCARKIERLLALVNKTFTYT